MIDITTQSFKNITISRLPIKNHPKLNANHPLLNNNLQIQLNLMHCSFCTAIFRTSPSSYP